MSVERGLARSMPFLPRYRSVSAAAPSPRRFPAVRSRSQPSQRLLYFQGTVSKYLAHPRSFHHSPSPQRVIIINTSSKGKTLTRVSRTGSYNDLHSSHVYSTLERLSDDREARRPALQILTSDARATSCGDIYHKGPFYPDATQSESGVSVGGSEDGSFLGTEDDNASQFSYGSSSAFHEITIDSELDRLDSEDGMGGLRSPASRFGFGDPRSPDNSASNRSSPAFSYADSRRRELMSSPSWDFDKTQSRHNALRVLIPAPDGSLAKERLGRKSSSGSGSGGGVGGSSTPLAQSTPQASPRSFAGPKLSIKGCWNVDDPYDEGVSSHSYSDSQEASKTIDESSCYSSFSEDNLSDVSSAKRDKALPRKVKLTKKSSDLPNKRSKTTAAAAVAAKSTSLADANRLEESLVSEESLEDVHVPPLESVIGELEEEEKPSWWAVFNIGSANARREEGGEGEEGTERDGRDPRQKITIVKPAKTGIPLISAGKHGQEKLRRRSRSSPPIGGSVLSPKSTSPSPSDQSDGSESDDVMENENGPAREPFIKRGCREYAEDVLKKVSQNLNVSDTGAFDVVRASSTYEPENTEAMSVNEVKVEPTTAPKKQGTQPTQGEPKSSSISQSSSPYVPLQFTLSFSLSFVKEEKKDDANKEDKAEESCIAENCTSQPLQLTPQQSSYSTVTLENPSLTVGPANRWREEPNVCESIVRSGDDHENDEENERTKGGHCRNYVLDNNNDKAPAVVAIRGRNEDEAPAIFTPLHTHPDLPGEGSPQVADEKRIAEEVGGSPGSSRSSESSSGGVGTTGLKAAVSHLTSQTPGKGEKEEEKGEEDNNNGSSSPCSSHSVEIPARSADGFSLAEKGSENTGTVHSTDYPGEEIDNLCSEFKAVVNISDFVVPTVQERANKEEDGDKDYQTEKANPTPFSFEIKLAKDTKGKQDQDFKGVDNTRADSSSDRVISLTSAAVVEDEDGSNAVAEGQFEILSGNVGLEESKQTEASSGQALAKSSLDPDCQEADSPMEWIFIDPRARLARGKPHEEEEDWRERRGNAGEVEDGITSPMIVTVLATAQLPSDDESLDRNQKRLDSDREIRVPEDRDSHSHAIHGGFPVEERVYQEYSDNDYNHQQFSQCHHHSLEENNDLFQNNFLHDTTDNARLVSDVNDTRVAGENLWSEYSNITNNIKDGSIKYPTSFDDEGNLSTGNKGIPQFQKNAAQNVGLSSTTTSAAAITTNATNGDGDEREERRSEHTFLSHSPDDGLATAESRADTEGPAGPTTLSQQVKHIHRKTVEETVTIERSSCTTRSSNRSSYHPFDGRFEDCENRVEVFKNRKETVILEEDEDIFTTTTTTTKTGPVSYVPSAVVPSRIDENVSSRSDSGVASLGVNRENPLVGDLTHSGPALTQSQGDLIDDTDDCPPPLPSTPPPSLPPSTPPPLPSSPPPSALHHEPSDIHDTPVTYATYLSTHPSNAHDVGQYDLESEDDLYASVLRWRDGVVSSAGPITTTPITTTTTTTTAPTTHAIAASTSLDPPSFDPSVHLVEDKSMVIEVEREMKQARPLSHQAAVLDHIQAQLSQISEGGVGGGIGGFDLISAPHTHPYNNNKSNNNIYHDHGKATTTTLTTHVFDFQGEAGHSVNNAEQHSTNGHDPTLCVAASAAINTTSSERGIPDVEIYDNDYDYVTSDQTKGAQLAPARQQHHLPKSGQLKTSSLWTLKEETDSLLEALSPVTSPKRNFSSTATTPLEERKDTNVSHNNNNNENVTIHLKESTSGVESESRTFTPIHPILQSFPSAHEQNRRKRFGSESSDFDESDGNYSSISTAESSSFRSSSYGREQTPLSDSDLGVPGDFCADKINYRGRTTTATTSQSEGQRVDGVSSFHDFVNGLESDVLTSDWADESQSGSLVSNNGFNQQRAPMNSGDESLDNVAPPTTFKSSLAFCVSAPSQTQHIQTQNLIGDADQEMTSLEDESKVTAFFQHPTNTSIPIMSSSSSFTTPPQAKILSSSFASRSTRLPPFPTTDDDYMMNTSTTSSSGFLPTDDAHSSEASSRLHALDLDLSRISSCASPTPSDVSDGSMFTCKGTAEIKRGHSVSFEDDYDMLPVSASVSVSHNVPTSTPKPLKSVLKKPQATAIIHDDGRSQEKESHQLAWVKQFDRILEDFNTRTCPLGAGSEVTVQEFLHPDPQSAGFSASQGPNFKDLYKTFTNDDSEKKQNHLCPVVEDDNMGTFRFKRFLKKSHHKRNSKGRRLVRFLSRLSCVSESVQSPDLSATRKRARLDNGQSYGTDFQPAPEERIHHHHKPLTATSLSFQHSESGSGRGGVLLSQANDQSPSSSNHSLDSSPSRTDSAYSSVSESLSSMLNNSPRSTTTGRYSNSTSRLANGNSFGQSDSSDHYHHHYYLDSVNSSTSDYCPSLRPDSETTDPFSPGPRSADDGGKYSREMMTALSDVFDQLDVCQGEIDTALLDRLRSGHHAVHFSKDA